MQRSGQVLEVTIASIGGETRRFKFRKKSYLADVSDRICEAFGKYKFMYFANLIVDGRLFDDMVDTPFANATKDSTISVVFEDRYSHEFLVENGIPSPD